ncbi:melatonin receptor type 1B-A-like [Patiria miniata]|uniref:G-protein coupled receptors family 1 profile domain-containing protein n=1 Tax=Patiria miniata TaxID=46514 RepID=A0A914B7J0_PATMI|nr:melatonin receptor type 1B-A-like [Patiria miniata]
MSTVVTEGVTLDPTESSTFEFSDYTQRVIVATMFLVIALLGIFGNTLVILAVLLSKKVRTATNAFVMNLSVADFLTCLVIPWNAVVLLGREGLPVGVWVCSITAVVQYASVGCSIFSLVAIALNRFLLITRPATTYNKVYTPKKIIIWLVLVWLVPLSISIVPSFINIVEFTYNDKYHVCMSLHSKASAGPATYNIIVAGVIYPILLIIIIVCYVLIWRHLKRHSRRMAMVHQVASDLTPSSIPTTTTVTIPLAHMTSDDQIQSPASPSSVPAIHSHVTRRQNDITKNMFYVVCAFMLCITPYAVVVMCGDSPARPYLFALFFFNSCVNPVIYATKHRDFKTIFGCILRRNLAAVPEPSEFLKFLQRNMCCGTTEYRAVNINRTQSSLV